MLENPRTRCGEYARGSAWMLIMMLASGLTGCAGFSCLQDTHYCVTNKFRAEVAWFSHADMAERQKLGTDFAFGYKRGFYAASVGRGCTLPAVPPPCYWSTKYQNCEGQVAVQDWYRGFQCGAAHAMGQGYPAFHDIPVGPCAPNVNVTGCQGCYAPEKCGSRECNPGLATPGLVETFGTHEESYHGYADSRHVTGPEILEGDPLQMVP